MKAVVEGCSSVNKAAREYGVPRTTLQDRITGRVVHGTTVNLGLVSHSQTLFLHTALIN